MPLRVKHTLNVRPDNKDLVFSLQNLITFPNLRFNLLTAELVHDYPCQLEERQREGLNDDGCSQLNSATPKITWLKEFMAE